MFRAIKLWIFPWWVVFVISTLVALGLGIALLVYAFKTKEALDYAVYMST